MSDLLEMLHRVMDQADNDLKSAHAEICKLAGLDPTTQKWPDWTPQANSIRWHQELRAQFPRGSAEMSGEAESADERTRKIVAWLRGAEVDYRDLPLRSGSREASLIAALADAIERDFLSPAGQEG